MIRARHAAAGEEHEAEQERDDPREAEGAEVEQLLSDAYMGGDGQVRLDKACINQLRHAADNVARAVGQDRA